MAMEGFVWEDQAPLLRQLPLNLVELLWANDWRCPFLLDTGFDTELEAYTLVAGLPGSTETAATNRRFARILVAWSLRNCSTIQRLRKRAASTDPYQQAATLQESGRGTLHVRLRLFHRLLKYCSVQTIGETVVNDARPRPTDWTAEN